MPRRTYRTAPAALGVVVAAGTLVTQPPAGPADWATAAGCGLLAGLILAWRLQPQPDPDPED